MDEDVKKLAKEHADWFIPTVRQIYEDAFIHGYKHGRVDAQIKRG